VVFHKTAVSCQRISFPPARMVKELMRRDHRTEQTSESLATVNGLAAVSGFAR
jgi:hypothetical protein